MKKLIAMIGVLVFAATAANATSQFSRRYGISCKVCHAAFPRLTAYGEKFKMNGYQVPGTSGEDTETKVGDKLFLPKISDIFGLRVSLIPFSSAKGSLTVNGNTKDKTSVGRGQWLQLFTAGPIFKNVSIFIETEFQNDTLHNNWMYMGFHNLAGPEGYLNVRVGNLPAFDWHTVSGRLRANPPLKYAILSDFKSAAGASGNEDQLGIGSANAGAEVYGYAGNIVYSAVIQDGKQQSKSDPDKNQYKNYTGTLGWRINSGDFEGSQVSAVAMQAVDTKNTATAQIKDFLNVFSPGLTIRYKGFDFQSAFLYAKDDNFKLDSNKNEVITRGIGASAGYFLKDEWFTHLQYDWLDSNDAEKLNKYITKNKVSPSIWYFPKENIRIGLTIKYDLDAKRTEHPYKNHEVFSTIRAMF